MDQEFKVLYEKAKALTGEKVLNNNVSYAQVGVALLTEQGNIYTGISIIAHCGIGFCAEHSAIAEMLKNNEDRILKIVATDKDGACPPCGRCRELIKQVNIENMKTQIMISEDEVYTLEELLPHAWILK